jgi:fructose-1,6-bisphosphatase/inositol monophosphatase family enzyme
LVQKIGQVTDVAKKFVDSGVLMNLSREARHLRALGCGQLALAYVYVATGRLQGFLQLSTYLWDQVAGIVLVRCAGGFAWNPVTGDDWNCSSKNLLAVGNIHLREAMLNFRKNHPFPPDSNTPDT